MGRIITKKKEKKSQKPLFHLLSLSFEEEEERVRTFFLEGGRKGCNRERDVVFQQRRRTRHIGKTFSYSWR